MINQEKIWTVSGFLDHLNDFLSEEKAIILGEVNGLKKHPTGLYFTLKDKDGEGILQCYLSPWKFKMMGMDLEDGFLIRAEGVPAIYKPRGSFSFVVEKAEIVGEGSLKKAYDILKDKLEKEGLFGRKRDLGRFISRVGVITSKSGAVIDDFRKNLKKLGIKIYLYDSRVEGAEAVPNIVSGLDYFNDKIPGKIDVIVLIRGGGSLEDLQAFNNEILSRKIFASKIPVLCGIGHDRDVPIASLTCDQSVSTPSMAAQTINASWDDLFFGLPLLSRRLSSGFEALISGISNKVDGFLAPLMNIIRSEIESLNEKTEHFSKVLSASDPMKNLKLGYSVVFDSKNRVVKDVKFLKKGDKIKTKLHKGSIQSEISGILGE